MANDVIVAQSVPEARNMLMALKPKIENALPERRRMQVQHFITGAILAIQKNNYLLRCKRNTFISALFEAARLGLMPGTVLGECALVPYKGNVQFQLMYRGCVALAMRTGRLAKFEAEVVYVNEHFKFCRRGGELILEHDPIFEEELQGDLRLAYAVATLKDGGWQPEIMSGHEIIEKIEKKQIEQIKDDDPERQEAKRNASPWRAWRSEMWRKTVTKRLWKRIPMSEEDYSIARAVEVDGAVIHDERGDAIEGPEDSPEAPVQTATPPVIEIRTTPPGVATPPVLSLPHAQQQTWLAAASTPAA